MAADHRRLGVVAALLVKQEQRRPLLAGQVGVAPAHDRHDRRIQVAAHRGQLVLVALGLLVVADLLQDPGARERLQTGREDVAGDPEVALQLGEAADPEERLAHDQEGPALAENLHRAADRTWLMLHHVTVSRWRSRSSTATTTSCYAAGASGRAPARAPPHVRGRAQAARPRARGRAPRRALARGPAARARR